MEETTAVTTTQAPQLQAPQAQNPFTRPQSEHLAHGAVAIESERAVAEAQGKLVIAKRFPRDPFKSFERIIEACKRIGLAQEALYAFPRAGQTVTGPSIRLAEELARCWGNIDYGLRELSNREGVSEMEAYAWDLETNTSSRQQFTVRHLRDKKGGAEELRDQRDIYEVTANMGARRMRARILAILPADIVDAAVAQVRKTIEEKGAKEPMGERVKRMLAAFLSVGVQGKLVEERLGHPLDQTTPDELVDLQGIHKSLKDGQSKVADWFGAKIEGPPPADDKKRRPKAEKAAAAEKKPEEKPADKPEGTPPAGAPAAKPADVAKRVERIPGEDDGDDAEDLF